MNKAITLRRLLAAPPHLRASFLRQTIISQISRPYAVQSVTQPSFWKSLVPKPLRKSAPSTVSKKKPKSKDWNPATFFIWIFLLIGSMSIQMIALRNGFAAFERRADAKIGLLKEVIERIQNGEKVDVSGLLGKGDQKQEEEWEQVLRDIEREEDAWAQTNKRKRKVARAEANSDKSVVEPDAESKEVPQPKSKSNAPRGFY